jgi:hypothetical protein
MRSAWKVTLHSSSVINPPIPITRTAWPWLQYEIDTDSIGNVICKKAEELEAVVTVLARHRLVAGHAAI